MRPLSLLSILLLVGCSPKPEEAPDRGAEKVRSSSVASDSSDNTGDNSSNKQLEAVKRMYGDIELREWKSLTSANIGASVSEDDMLAIIGGQGKVTREKTSTGAWRFATEVPERKKGSVTIEILLKDMPESSMITQVGVRKEMVKKDKGDIEEVDMSAYGVVAFWDSGKGKADLDVCTKHTFLHISANKMLGRDFTDKAVKKEAAMKIATMLFDRIGQ